MKKLIFFWSMILIGFVIFSIHIDNPLIRIVSIIFLLLAIAFWFHLVSICIEDNSLRERARSRTKNFLFFLFVCTTATGFYVANDRYDKLEAAFFEYAEHNQKLTTDLSQRIESNNALLENIYDIKKIDPNIPSHLKGKITIW